LDERAPARGPGTLNRWARKLVMSRLATLEHGALRIVESDRSERFGDPASPLQATIHIDDPAFFRQLITRGGMGGAEGYLDGLWHTDDLPAVIRIMALNQIAGLNKGLARLARPSLALFHALRPNSQAGSRRNIAAHYDLGNEFFELFLDPTLTYSSGVFERPEATMEEASVAKYERICRKLKLTASDHVLEIGSGWGGFALHAASRYGCRVTTTTISRRQFERAHARVAAAGLTERVEVVLRDYRELEGHYDKLVSIEMIEAVGHAHLPEYFRRCGELLAPDGVMLLQAITVSDQHLRAYLRGVDFIKRYIFPGGELVSLGSMNAAAASESDLRPTHFEDISPHYAETLRRWRARLLANREEARALGLSEEFLRMWEFYLAYCEGGFEERQIGVGQLVLEKPLARRNSVLGSLTFRQT